MSDLTEPCREFNIVISAKQQKQLYEQQREADRKRLDDARAKQRATDQRLAREAKELARTSDVETSHAAAAHNPTGKESQRRACLQLHARHPAGLTDDEVSYLAGDEVWRRCSDLRRLGLIAWLYQTGEDGRSRPLTRRARSGRQGRVSVITNDGLAALNEGA